MAVATGVPGRVGVKRTVGAALPTLDDGSAVAGASGLNGGGVLATGGVLAAGVVEGVVPGVDVETVSPGLGAGLVLELHPGFAKIRTSAKTWMPTTMPKIFRIFIGGMVGRVVKLQGGECYLKLGAAAARFSTSCSNCVPRSS